MLEKLLRARVLKSREPQSSRSWDSTWSSTNEERQLYDPEIAHRGGQKNGPTWQAMVAVGLFDRGTVLG